MKGRKAVIERLNALLTCELTAADQFFVHSRMYQDWGLQKLYAREAQILIEQWRKHYNTKRPHSALGYRPPAPEIIIPMDQRPVMH